MLHAIDVRLSSGGWRTLIKSEVFDRVPLRVWQALGKEPGYAVTPRHYAQIVGKTLGLQPKSWQLAPISALAIDPEILTEGYQIGYNRITKDGRTNYRYRREGCLLIRLCKVL